MLKKSRNKLNKGKRLIKKATRKLKPRVKKAVGRNRVRKITPPVSIRENTLKFAAVVESLKYSTAQPQGTSGQLPVELPLQYGQDKITIVIRDARWIYAYWEVTPQSRDSASRQWGERFNNAKLTLRVYDVSDIVFDGLNARGYFDVLINEYANSWYIETAGPGKSFCVDIGYLLPGKEFVTIARSNRVLMPIEGPSNITDEEWMVSEETFARLYGMGFGLGQSSPVGRAWQEKIKQALFLGISGSPGIASMVSSPKKG